MQFNINIDAFLTSLSIMWKGMLGIFIVIAAIYLCIFLLSKLKKKSKE